MILSRRWAHALKLELFLHAYSRLLGSEPEVLCRVRTFSFHPFDALRKQKILYCIVFSAATTTHKTGRYTRVYTLAGDEKRRAGTDNFFCVSLRCCFYSPLHYLLSGCTTTNCVQSEKKVSIMWKFSLCHIFESCRRSNILKISALEKFIIIIFIKNSALHQQKNNIWKL